MIYLIKLPHYYHTHDRNLPLGLLYLGSYLKKKGLSVKLIDLSGLREDQWKIPLDGAFYCVSSNTPDYLLAVKISRYLKKKTKATLVIGGIHATSLPDEVLKDSEFDIVVSGEGEHTLFEIVNGEPREQIRGIFYRRNGRIIRNPERKLEKNLDAFPQPDLSLIDLKEYMCPIIIKDSRTKGIPMITSRGCPYQCIFCASSTMWHRTTRFHSLDYIKENLDYYLSLDIKNIFFCDDTIIIKKNHFIKICQELSKREITWRCSATTNILTKELTDLMFECGCRQVDFGIESGSDRILKIIKKSSTAQENLEAIHMAKNSGLMTKSMLMVGHPFETEKDVLETINFIKKAPSDLWALTVFIPLPGCEVAKDPTRFEFDIDESLGYEDYLITAKVKDTPIIHKQKDKIRRFRNMIYEAIGDKGTLDTIKRRDESWNREIIDFCE